MSVEPKPSASTRIMPIEPPQITIQGSEPLIRTFHRDSRGFLIEGLRSDDRSVNGSHFRMTYSSLTLPGHFRDMDRWHLHRIQTDRFVVVLGEMMLALYDDREGSSTKGTLEVIRMRGEPFAGPWDYQRSEGKTYLVPIPPGVLHCIGNLSHHPFLLQNYPTELYDPSDEGRVPFATLPIAKLGDPFDWSKVIRISEAEENPRPTS